MQHDPLTLTFGALADPTRRALLARLSLGQASVGELAEPFDMSTAAVSKHLKVLENAGLITRHKRSQYNYCTLQAGPLKDVDSWVGSYRTLWQNNLEQLDGYLAELQSVDPNSSKQ
jgi:DNA-binding transcriptional ArsR family regulator